MTRLKVLIVDDDEDFADGLMEIFELDGHKPAIAHSGGEAKSAIEAGDFDVALIDVGLPDMNGIECLRAIRAARPTLPCFLLTGYSAQDVAGQGIAAGAIEILTKPIDPAELIHRLTAI